MGRHRNRAFKGQILITLQTRMSSILCDNTLIHTYWDKVEKVGPTFCKFTPNATVLIFSNFAHPCPFQFAFVSLMSSATVLIHFCDISVILYNQLDSAEFA